MPSKAEARALRLMRKLDEATSGKPQHWETLDKLGAVQADAAAIVYAVEKGWMNVAPQHDPHSANLTEDGRQRLRGVKISSSADRPQPRKRTSPPRSKRS